MDCNNLSHDKQCYLCGIRPADTKDHLFPSGLFNRPLPTNLITLPACRECNNALSSDEEQFRVFVASGKAIETEAGFRVWTERIRPDLKESRPRPLAPQGADHKSQTGTYDGRTFVTLMASPSEGYQFALWFGNAYGTSPTITISMDTNKNITAYFTLIPHKSSFFTIRNSLFSHKCFVTFYYRVPPLSPHFRFFVLFQRTDRLRQFDRVNIFDLLPV